MMLVVLVAQVGASSGAGPLKLSPLWAARGRA
jgi:hypothetical protein